MRGWVGVFWADGARSTCNLCAVWVVGSAALFEFRANAQTDVDSAFWLLILFLFLPIYDLEMLRS
jgi:hypothetical protein